MDGQIMTRAPAPDPKPRHWADRVYTPIEAAYAATQYLDFDPAFFLLQCEAAGMSVGTDGKLIHFRAGGVDGTTAFLQAWLRADRTGAGKKLRTSLKRRRLFDDSTVALREDLSPV